MKTKVSRFDKLMIGVIFAEANAEEPDLPCGNPNDWLHNEQELIGPFDGEVVSSL